MAGLILPLNLDTSGFNKALNDAEKKIGSMTAFLNKATSESVHITSKINTEFERANTKARTLVGTAQQLRDAMSSIENLSGAINLKTAAGQEQIMKQYTEWTKVRTALGDVNISFERLYKMQQEYQKLTGKEYKMTTLADAKNLPSLIEQEKEIMRLIEEERKAKEKMAEDAARAAQKQYDEDSKFLQLKLKAEQEMENQRIRSRSRESKAAFEEHFKEKEAKERANADRIAADALNMKANSVKEYQSKIIALERAQKQLDTTNASGKRKFEELGKAIAKSKTEVERLSNAKKATIDTADKLTKRFATLFSLNKIREFAMNVVKIGGELERQRIALGSIVNDISKANVLFSQLKSQALESPFSFKHLIAGTRQLAAYNIEAEKLYDTQFMMSELSAGLGVDVSRLILAYGQVRAAAVLRGQELRQFTEAGIPIIDALAKKFTELEGRVVSTAEVFEKVSERLVPFKMVHEVLSDMTTEGGKFYQMQAKQAETIYGQWVNLGDAFDIMYLDIAQSQEGIIVGTIKMLRTLVENWRSVLSFLTVMGAGYAAYGIISYNAHMKAAAASKQASKMLMTQVGVIKLARMAMMGFAAAAVAGIVAIVTHIITASQEMNRFRKSMDEINSRHANDAQRSSEDLQTYINQLRKAVVGSEEYKKIKDKIKSQYQDYIPLLIDENTSVEQIADSYEYATSALKAYYAEKAVQETKAKLGEDKGVKKQLESLEAAVRQTLNLAGVSDDNISRIIPTFTAQINELLLRGEDVGDVFEKLAEIAAKFGVSIGETFENTFGRGDAKTTLIFKTSEEINSVSDKYIKSIQKKITELGNSTKAYFGEHAEIITESMNLVNTAYDTAVQKSMQETDLTKMDREFKKKELSIAKKNAEIAATGMQTLIESVVKQGKTLDQKGKDAVSQFIQSVFDGGVADAKKYLEEGFSGSKDIVNQAYTKILNDIETARLRRGTDVQRQNEEFFRKQNELLKQQDAKLLTPNIQEKEDLKIKQEALAAVAGMVESYVSIGNMQTLLTKKEELSNSLWETKNLLMSETANEEIIANADKRTKELEGQLFYVEELIKLYNIQKKGTEGEDGKDPDIERARRLVSIYKEINQSYEKYIQYKGDDFSTQQSMNELQEEYNNLNKELGGRLPELNAIKSQKELVDAINNILKSDLFKTEKSRSVLTKALLGESGGQLVGEAKKEFEEIKKEAEKLLDKVVIGVNEDDIAAQVYAIIDRLKEMAGSGAGATAITEFIANLVLRIDDNNIKSILKDIDTRLEGIKDKYSAGSELKELNEQLMITMPDILTGSVIEYDEYIQSLKDIKDEYLASGDKGVEKAAEVERDIQKETFKYTKDLYMETFRLQQQMLSGEEKIENMQKRIVNITERLNTLKELASEDGLSEEQIERYKAEIMYYETIIESLGVQIAELRNESFRVGELYKKLYGDIEQYGRDAYASILESMKNVLDSAEEFYQAGSTKKMYKITYYTEKGELKEEVLTAKELGKATTDLAKAQRKIRESNPWKKISEDIKKVKGNVVDLEDGSKKTIINFDALGDAVSGIGEEIGKLKELGEVLGLDEQTQDYIEGIGGGVESIGKLIASKGTDIGAWVQLIKSWIQIFDADNNKRIREHEKAISNLETAYQKLQKSIKDIVNIEDQNRAITDSLIMLRQVEASYRQMAMEEQMKKGTDKKVVEEYLKKAEEAAENIKDTIQGISEEWSTSLSDAASTFANNWISAFEEIGSGISSLEKSFDDMIRNIVSKQLADSLIKVMIEPLITKLQQITAPSESQGLRGGRGGLGIDKSAGTQITEDEWAEFMQLLETTLSGSGEMGERIDKFLRLFGVKTKKDDFEYDTLQKGIQGITENTAQIIASYMNSIRIEVVTIRTLMEKQSSFANQANTGDLTNPMIEVRDVMLNFYPQYLDNLIAINEHTSYLKDAYEPAQRAFRMV